MLLAGCGGPEQSARAGSMGNSRMENVTDGLAGDLAENREQGSGQFSGEASSEPGLTEGGSEAAMEPGMQDASATKLPQPYAKYVEVLEQIRMEGHDPNGREYPREEGWNFENNCFAILDIDNDGKLELLFNFNESYMGAMCEVVYEYDEETDILREELVTWVSTEYYYSGLVKVDMSHNHGKDPEGRGVWPYMIYQYDAEEDCYQLIYTVDSWDGQIYEEGFPDELDVDGDKLLYYVTMEAEMTDGNLPGNTLGSNTENQTAGSGSMMIFDLEEYENWKQKLWMREEDRIEAAYHRMTEGYMENIKDAYIQASVYAAQADRWLFGEEGSSYISYLMYDLDGDGSMELTASVLQGSGRYSYNYFYGLGDNGKVTELEMVRLCGSKMRDWDADFDIGGGRTCVQTYRDDDGTIYYEGNDYLSNGIYGGYIESGFWYLKEGVVYQDSIRRRTDSFINASGDWEEETHYYGMEENEDGRISDEEITEERYEAIQEAYIGDMTAMRVRQNWVSIRRDGMEPEMVPEEAICGKLLESALGSG